MSQYYVPGVKPSDTVIVGYAPETDRFYADVFDADGMLVHFIAGEPLLMLAAKLAPYGVISLDTIAALINEKVEHVTSARAPGLEQARSR